jgi:hypothetical protein
MDFVRPMFEENNVLIVPLDKKAKFLDLDHVVAMGALKWEVLELTMRRYSAIFPSQQLFPCRILVTS